MNILVISQTFWPDNVATSQALSDLVFELAEKNHQMTVFTSRHNYENPAITYTNREVYKQVNILRLNNTGLGKRNTWYRVIDFLSFNILILFRLLRVSSKNTNLIISMTSPPMLPFLGVVIARVKQIRFVFWSMDLQPELSVVSGIIRKGSLLAIFLQKIIDYTYKKSDTIIALDKYMAHHILERVGQKKDIIIVPIWPMVMDVYNGQKEDNPFAREYSLTKKLIIMYSGNHSVVHPVKTLLDTAFALKNDNRFLFVHIGSGIRLKEIVERIEKDGLDNIRILPFQPREKIHYSLGSADIQVVILGDNCIGLTHPNKIYGAMYIGKPVLYIGPEPSHITDILKQCPGNIIVRHGEYELLCKKLSEFANLSMDSRLEIGETNKRYAIKNFDSTQLLNRMVETIETL